LKGPWNKGDAKKRQDIQVMTAKEKWRTADKGIKGISSPYEQAQET